MPSVSKKQHNFMEAVAHNPAFAKKAGVPQSVGQEFSKADTGRTFKRGGDMEKHEAHAHHMKMAHHHLKEAMKHGGTAHHKAYAKGGEVTGKHAVEEKKGMTTAKMGKVTAGGIKAHGEHSVQERGHTKAMMPKMAGSTTGMKRGGAAKHHHKK
jgi:hypothetical protein